MNLYVGNVNMEAVKSFGYCLEVFDYMRKNAVYNEELDNLVWEGKLTHAFKHDGELAHIGMSRYSKIMDHLKKMECVEVVERGGGNRGSIWIVSDDRPTEDTWKNTRGKWNNNNPYAKQKRLQKDRNMLERIEVLESNQLVLDRRLQKLES